MSTKKMLREIRRQSRLLDAKLDRIVSSKGHIKAVVLHGNGSQQPVTISSSPSNIDHTIDNVLREIRQFKDRHAAT